MTDYTLQLNFDIRQITQTLRYKFTNDNNSQKVKKLKEGPLAGTFNFQQGDKLSINVIAASSASEGEDGPASVIKDFKIVDCTLISIAQELKKDLSLFDANNASAYLTDFTEASPINGPETPDVRYMSSHSITALTVQSKSGQWKLSGFLSVVITTMDNQSYPQLYFFDPESTSGTGN